MKSALWCFPVLVVFLIMNLVDGCGLLSLSGENEYVYNSIIQSMIKLKQDRYDAQVASAVPEVDPKFLMDRQGRAGDEEEFMNIVDLGRVDEYFQWKAILGPANEALYDAFIFLLAIIRERYSFANKILVSLSHLSKLKTSPQSDLQANFMVFFHEIVLSRNKDTKLLSDLVYGFGAKLLSEGRPKNFPEYLHKKPASHEVQEFFNLCDGRIIEDSELIEAVRDNHEIRARMMLINLKYNLVYDYEEEVGALDLYRVAGENVEMMKILKGLKVPLLKDATSRPRRICYSKTGKERKACLDLMKLHESSSDRRIYYKMYPRSEPFISNINTASIRDQLIYLLKKKDSNLLENFFLRPGIGEYQKDWILLAIASGTSIECLRVLLEERVPLPSEEEMNRSSDKVNEEFMRVIREYRQKYFNNEGYAEDGPFESEKVKEVINYAFDYDISLIHAKAFENEECDPLMMMI